MSTSKNNVQNENEIRNYKVYIHTNTINNKQYVGITFQDVERRWRPDGSGYKQNKYFWNSIQKYGWNNFKHEIIADNLTKKDAEKLEQELIQKLNCKSPFGYNHDNGGCHNGKMSNEIKHKLSIAKTGKMTRYNNNCAKAVNIYTMEGKYIKTISNMSDIADELVVGVGAICQCCQGDLCTVKGYQIKYYSEYPDCLDISPVIYKENKTKRRIIKYSAQYITVSIYDSVMSAAKENNTTTGSIRYSCLNNTLHKGFFYRYA